MFKYTTAAYQSVLQDLKKWSVIFTWLLFAITTGYYIYAIAMEKGYLWANILSLSIIVVYTVFDTVTKYTNIKLVNKVSKTIFNWSRILIRAATLTLTVYGLCVATMDQINPIDIILTTLMIIMWFLSVLIEIVRNIFNSKKDLFIDAFHKDIEEIKKPITTTTNVVKRIFGKEVEEKEDSENIKKLSKFIYKNKEKGIKK